jgi:hypothetical protein
MSFVIVLLVAIDVAVVVVGLVPLRVPLPLLLYPKGGEVTRKVTELVTTLSQSGLYLYLPILHILL